MKIPDETLIEALRVLARDIESQDGVANACIAEAADRLQAFAEAFVNIYDAVLHERHQMAEMVFDNDQVNAVLGVIEDNDPRVLRSE